MRKAFRKHIVRDAFLEALASNGFVRCLMSWLISYSIWYGVTYVIVYL